MNRILIWAGPNQIWDLGRPSSKFVHPRSELGSGLDQFRTGSDSDLGFDKQLEKANFNSNQILNP